jgi:hypothetical protein
MTAASHSKVTSSVFYMKVRMRPPLLPPQAHASNAGTAEFPRFKSSRFHHGFKNIALFICKCLLHMLSSQTHCCRVQDLLITVA